MQPKTIYMTQVLALLLTAIGVSSSAVAAELRVVTTLTTYADVARSIGGSYVSVSSIVRPQFDPHFIEPRPSAVLRVKRG